VAPVRSNVGSRLISFANAWLSFSNDQWILFKVIHGYVIDFIEFPVRHSTPSGCIMSREIKIVCDQEDPTLLQKGTIVQVNSNSNEGFFLKWLPFVRNQAAGSQLLI
jgi:hypothetical protein